LPVATGPAALKSGSGLGLMLVRELVRTELHGVFSSAPNITGGLTATVEFPLKQKETELISL
jgi:two-component sensor histidine kinase